MAVRQNVTALTEPERQRFVQAVIALKSDTAASRGGTQISRYDQFVAIHLGVTRRFMGPNNQNIGDGGHNNAAFCPWHREFLRRYELALQEFEPDVTLPYWDWTEHAKTRDIVFADTFAGDLGGGSPQSNGQPVQTGPFAEANGWMVNAALHVPTIDDQNQSLGTALRRRATPFYQLASHGNVMRALDRQPFNQFRPALEAGPRLHNFGHNWIGGSMAMMSSPNDPIFFLHHANVDRLWAIWQDRNGEGIDRFGQLQTSYPNGGRPYGHNLPNRMWPWDGGESETEQWVEDLLPIVSANDIVRVRDVIDYRSLEYSYA